MPLRSKSSRNLPVTWPYTRFPRAPKGSGPILPEGRARFTRQAPPLTAGETVRIRGVRLTSHRTTEALHTVLPGAEGPRAYPLTKP